MKGKEAKLDKRQAVLELLELNRQQGVIKVLSRGLRMIRCVTLAAVRELMDWGAKGKRDSRRPYRDIYRSLPQSG